MAAGFGLQSIASALAVVVIAMGVIGFGFGLVMPNLSTTLLAAVPARLRGWFSGGLTSAIFLGQFLSLVFSQPLVERFGVEASFMISAMMMVAVGILCLIWAAWRTVWLGRPTSTSRSPRATTKG